MSDKAAEVTVIGGGLAGATAAFRLAQRGYNVTLFEQDAYLGGQFRAVPVPGRPEYYHEHCYHLFDGWYHNFWNLIGELGLRDHFVGRRAVKYLRRGEFPKMTELKDVGALSSYFENLFSGVLSIPDMYLFLYSYVELLASPLQGERYRDMSVSEFMRSRPFATDRSAAMHENVLFKAFGVPISHCSAQSYRKFVGFGAVEPAPMFYVMKGNVHDHFWAYLEAALVKLGVKIFRRHRLKEIKLSDDGDINHLTLERLAHSSTSVDPERVGVEKNSFAYPVNGSVVLAVPPGSLSNLITPDLYSREPRWGLALKLRTEPMASVHLHFTEKFVNRLERSGMKTRPKEPVILLDSRYSITFLDNSGTWPELDRPYLHVIASDYKELSRLEVSNPQQYTDHRETRGIAATSGQLNLRNPKSPLDHILAEVARYVPFEPDEVDLDLLEIEPSTRYPIFINEIGGWPHRPATKPAIANLFMVGAHCQTFIDVTTVEGAVLSGLEAATGVQRRHHVGEPVDIVYPAARPFYFYAPWQLMGAPAAMMAKVWSELDDRRKRAGRVDRAPSPGRDGKQPTLDAMAELIGAPYEFAAEVMSRMLDISRR